MIKVLIVDDSAFMRAALSRMLTSDPTIEIVGQASDGIEALEKITQLNPDVITLDIEMPRMDGLATLEELMKKNPKPVLMVSSLTSAGADATLRALELGALDYMPKYQEGSVVFAVAQKELTDKIKALAKRAPYLRLQASHAQKTSQAAPIHGKILGTTVGSSQIKVAPPVDTSGRPKRDIIALGVSTGGPPAVQKVLAQLPADFPACILIAQHMPSAFTGAFAARLNSLCKITVKEAQDGDPLAHGVAYVCPGGQHISIAINGALPQIKISKSPEDALYKPSASVLNETVAVLGSKVVGLTMTGMGSDGLEGTKVLKAKGGYIIAQNEASCVVYGMPRAVVDAGLADEVVDIDEIAETLKKAIYR